MLAEAGPLLLPLALFSGFCLAVKRKQVLYTACLLIGFLDSFSE
jgi:hypothetical protein